MWWSTKIERDPAGNPSPYSSAINEYTDPNLQNGTVYKYRVWAVDHAGNQSQPTDWQQGIVGLAEVPYVSDKGSVAEYHNVTLFILPQSLPLQIQNVQITEVQSNEMQQKVMFPTASPIYQFSTTFNDGQTATNLDQVVFQKDFVVSLQYDPSLLVPGFPEQNLGVYYFDPMWSKWLKVPNSGVDVGASYYLFFNQSFYRLCGSTNLGSGSHPSRIK